MIAEPELTFTPTGSYLRVTVTRPATETKSGILLAEVSQRRPAEGTVVAVGPGRPIGDSGERTVIWPVPSDIIVWDPHAFQEITDCWDGLIPSESVLGIVDPDTGIVIPENDFLAIEPDETEQETRGGIVLVERYRERAKRGTILDYGPGLIRTSGPRSGIRKTIRAILALDNGEPLIGRHVWWQGAARSFQIGGPQPCLMIKANDLMLID